MWYLICKARENKEAASSDPFFLCWIVSDPENKFPLFFFQVETFLNQKKLLSRKDVVKVHLLLVIANPLARNVHLMTTLSVIPNAGMTVWLQVRYHIIGSSLSGGRFLVNMFHTKNHCSVECFPWECLPIRSSVSKSSFDR